MNSTGQTIENGDRDYSSSYIAGIIEWTRRAAAVGNNNNKFLLVLFPSRLDFGERPMID